MSNLQQIQSPATIDLIAREAQVFAQRAATLRPKVADLNEQVSDLESQIADLEARRRVIEPQRDASVKALTDAETRQSDLRVIVEAACAQKGWAFPAVPDDVVRQSTGEIPIVGSGPYPVLSEEALAQAAKDNPIPPLPDDDSDDEDDDPVPPAAETGDGDEEPRTAAKIRDRAKSLFAFLARPYQARHAAVAT